MKADRIKKLLYGILVALFWIAVWFILSIIVNNDFLLPSPISTVKELFLLMSEASFYKVVFYTLIRVILGVVIGVLAGVILAFLSHYYFFVRKLISPLMTIIKSTPVVTFITLLWIIMSGNVLTVFIAFMMVMPIIWQNLLEGLDTIPKDLSEVCKVFEIGKLKTFRLLVLPTLLKYFFPAVITSIGLAWKAEIATEVIAYTKVSIGQYIYDAKYNLLTDRVFAWVIVIVLFSIILESLTKLTLRRLKNWQS